MTGQLGREVEKLNFVYTLDKTSYNLLQYLGPQLQGYIFYYKPDILA